MTHALTTVLKLDELSPAGLALTLVPTPDEQAALAERFGLLEPPELHAELTVRTEGEDVRVFGRLRAHAVQACVLSGAPVPEDIEEAIDTLYRRLPANDPHAEIELSEDDLDIEPLAGGQIDLGELVAQCFGVALNPYPHASGDAVAEARRFVSDEEAEAIRRNPFAVLKQAHDLGE